MNGEPTARTDAAEKTVVGTDAPGTSADPGQPARRSAWAVVKPWLRGEPLHVPSHALVIHFPAALLPTSCALDLAATVDRGAGLEPTAGLLLVLGLAGAVVAAATGLLDWWDMIPGTPRRSRVTRHLLVQVGAIAVFTAALILRAGASGPTAPPGALIASVAGTALLFAGNHLGGLLVYRDAMRVRTRRAP